MLANRFSSAFVFVLALNIVTGSKLALASSLPANVRGVVIVTPGVNGSDAKTYATQHDKLLLSDELESLRPGDEHDTMIKRKLERAQHAWLAGDIESARAEFRALSELSLKADWREDQREVLQTAALRLAQSSESTSERDGWLETAARLYGDLEPSASLFPPPLLNEYSAVLKRLATSAIEIDLTDIFTDFRYVLIDGRKVEIASHPRLKLTTGLHRLTALSDSHESVTEFLTASQLRILRLSPPALSESTCENATLRSRNGIPSNISIEIYSGGGCPPKLTNMLSGSRFLSAPTSLEAPLAPQASRTEHPWIWVAGAAVVAGLGYALVSHANSATEPSHRSGF